MGERLVPATWRDLDPLIRNFVENGATVQWLHRIIGTILGFAVIALFARTRALPSDIWSKRYATLLVAIVVIQYLLGVLTLIHAVPVALGVTHQTVALLLWGAWVIWWHHSVTLSRASAQQFRSQSARGTEASVR